MSAGPGDIRGDGPSPALFSCKRCGHCCQGKGTVSLSPAEQETLAAFLGLKRQTFLEAFCRIKGNRVEMQIVDGHCIFFRPDGLCAVHQVKPFHCRRWPLHPSVLVDPAAWRAIQADCPGFHPEATYEAVCELVQRRHLGP